MSITIEKETAGKYEEKKSIFLAYILKVNNAEEFNKRLEELKIQHSKARHILTTYRIDSAKEAASEDKEPIKSSHIILEILKKNNLTKIGVVLVRYYGGILLGASNLEKAYIKVFTEAMNQAKKIDEKELPIYKLEISNKDYSRLLKALSSDDIVVSKEFYGPNVVLKVAGPNIEQLFNELGCEYKDTYERKLFAVSI